jgi:hypothetical protein
MLNSSDLAITAENIHAQPGIHPWTWKLRVDNPRNPTDYILERMTVWCMCTVGIRGLHWNRKGTRFYFAYKQDAMTFKLTWHGTPS